MIKLTKLLSEIKQINSSFNNDYELFALLNNNPSTLKFLILSIIKNEILDKHGMYDDAFSVLEIYNNDYEDAKVEKSSLYKNVYYIDGYLNIYFSINHKNLLDVIHHIQNDLTFVKLGDREIYYFIKGTTE